MDIHMPTLTDDQDQKLSIDDTFSDYSSDDGEDLLGLDFLR